jgi:CubicO group peptidase (beta-lactamase class C family)
MSREREPQHRTKALIGHRIRWFLFILFFAVAGAVATPTVWGQAAGSVPDPIDDLVRREMAARKLPSVALAVVKDGIIVKQAAYGYARVSPDLAATPSTRYRLASVTKQFTAAAILILQQQGRLRLEDSVRQYLVDAPASWANITIRDLLTHTSGFPHDSPAGYGSLADQASHPRDLLNRLYQIRPLTPPGTHYQYSNAGYALLGAIIETVSGQSYGQFLSQNIFAPAGMSDTRVDDENYSDPRLAMGYAWESPLGRWQARSQGYAPLAAGSVQSTVLDLAKWEAALETDAILTAESKKQMWTPLVLKNGVEYDYGFAWLVQDTPAGPFISHAGSGWGYSTAFYRYPDAGYAIIVLTNLQPSKNNYHASVLADAIASYYLSSPSSVAAKSSGQWAVASGQQKQLSVVSGR